MPTPVFKTRADLDSMIEELDRKLEALYRTTEKASRPEVWAGLTSAALKLVAPEDQDYAYDRLYAVFKSHQASSSPTSNLPADAG